MAGLIDIYEDLGDCAIKFGRYLTLYLTGGIKRSGKRPVLNHEHTVLFADTDDAECDLILALCQDNRRSVLLRIILQSNRKVGRIPDDDICKAI